MAPSRRNTNGRSPLVNQQRQITSFFSKSTSPSPSPILSNSSQKTNPNSIPGSNPSTSPSPSPSPTTPSPRNPKPYKPLLVIGASSPSSPASSLYGQEVVGRRIKVYWPLDKAWYEGFVKSFDKLTSKHLVQYDDGEEESLDLSKEKIEWLQESVKKLKRLRRGFSSFKKMVIEDDEVEESVCNDDSSDADWGKNEGVEGAGDSEEDVELEDEEVDDVAERSKRKPSGEVQHRKRKLGRAEKFGIAKKSKGGAEVGKGGFKLPSSEPSSNLESK